MDIAGTGAKMNPPETDRAGMNAAGTHCTDPAAVGQLKVAVQTDKLIIVSAQTDDASACVVQYFRRAGNTDDGDGAWTELLRTGGVLGERGIGKTKEGDRKTPVGAFHFSKLFGNRPDPGTLMGYTQLTDAMYWCGSGVRYNEFVDDAVDTEHREHCDHANDEHLKAVGMLYDYVAALDYNRERAPGKGSAIFLHVRRPGGTCTAGCVAVDEPEMELLIRQIDERTIILIDRYDRIGGY